MKSVKPLAWAIGVAVPLLSACVSTVHVDKVPNRKADVEGIRYHLPEVFLQATPNADGTLAVQFVYLPNPNEEYAIRSTSFLSNYTLQVKRTQSGLLEAVTFNTDSSAVAQQALSSAGAIRAAEINAEVAKAKTVATEEKAAADKAKAAIDAANKARIDAAVAVEVAQRKLGLLEGLVGTPNAPTNIKDQVLSAKLVVVEAEAKREAAEAAYQALVGAANTDVDAANAAAKWAGANAPAGRVFPQAPQPMFYRVTMDADKVELREAFAQDDRNTWTAPKAEMKQDAFAVLPSQIVVRPADKTGALTAPVKANRALESVAITAFTTATQAPVTPIPYVVVRSDGLSVDFELPKKLPDGDYLLRVDVKAKGKEPVLKYTLRIRVER